MAKRMTVSLPFLVAEEGRRIARRQRTTVSRLVRRLLLAEIERWRDAEGKPPLEPAWGLKPRWGDSAGTSWRDGK